MRVYVAPCAPEGFFPWGGAAVAKFHFTNSEIRRKTFSTKKLKAKEKISKSRGARLPCPPFPTTMRGSLCANSTTVWQVSLAAACLFGLHALQEAGSNWRHSTPL